MTLSWMTTLKRRVRLVWLIIFSLTGLTFLTAMLSRQDARLPEINIEIEPLQDGGRMLTEADIRQLLKKTHAVSSASELTAESLAEIERVVRAHPAVDQADVYVDTRSQVRIRVTQPEPLLRIVDSRGANYYLDKEVQRIPVSTCHTSRVVVATGAIPFYRDSLQAHPEHILTQLVRLGQALGEDEFLDALIEQIDVRQGEIYLIPKMGDFKFLLGDTRDLEDKLDLLKLFYEKILPAKGWNRYGIINLSYKGQIVCTDA